VLSWRSLRHLESSVREDHRDVPVSMRNQLSSEPTHRMDGRNTYRGFNIFELHNTCNPIFLPYSREHVSWLGAAVVCSPPPHSNKQTILLYQLHPPHGLWHIARGRKNSSRAGDHKPDGRRQGGTSRMKTSYRYVCRPLIDSRMDPSSSAVISKR
jgi:hypothetical protein